MQERLTIDQYRKLQERRNEEALRQARQKYGNLRVEVDGIKFQSHKEAKYYGLCKIRVAARDLIKFERQVNYDLAVNGIHITTYRADFVLYYPDGRIEVVDVKSHITAEIPLYKIKKALMKAILGITILER